MNQEGILLSDPTIIQYFNANPHLDPNTLVVLFINILTQLSTNLNSSITNASITQLLTRITEINSSVASIKSEVNNTIRDQSVKIENIILKDRETLGGLLSEKTNLAVSNSNRNIQSIISNVQDKHNSNVYNFHQELKQLVISSNEKTQRDVGIINEHLSKHERNQESLTSELTGFLNKYKNNSSIKGNVSEKELYNMLQYLFPTDELVVCTKTTASCDICVNRADPTLPSILFENKDYTASVDKEEIKKFERDLHTQKKHGIFISQNSPITFKSNYHIDIIDGLIHLYLPNANYDIDKLKIAVDIVDHLSLKLSSDIVSAGDVRISHTEMSEILNEYKNFATRKTRLLDGIRSNTKMWIDELDAITLPRIQTLLIHTGNIEKCNLTCTYCMTFTGKNKASLSAHIKGCKLTHPK